MGRFAVPKSDTSKLMSEVIQYSITLASAGYRDVKGYIEENLPSIEVLEGPYGGEDCEMYALGTNRMMNRLGVVYPDTETPEEGSYVFFSDRSGRYNHVARLAGKGIIEQKVSVHGPVVRGPIELIPEEYGPFYSFKNIPDEDLRFWKRDSGITGD